MKLSVIYQPSMPASASPYRLRDENGRELDWANAFLDAHRLRQLSFRSLRAYAYDLLNSARWFEPRRQRLAEITESTLVDYVRHQLEQHPKPTPPTVNHRLGVVRCCYRFHTGRDVPAGPFHFQQSYRTHSPLGYGRPRRAIALGLHLKQDRRVILPLAAEEVAKFWQSFRSYRDLALVGLMLLDGLRSCEVLGLHSYGGKGAGHPHRDHQGQRATGGTRWSRWKAAAFNGGHEPDESRGSRPDL